MHDDPVALAKALAADARGRGENSLPEMEGFRVLEALGVRAPRRLFVRNSEEVEHIDCSSLGDRVVVKVVAPGILHKSEVGGVVVVANERAALRAAIAAMQRTFAASDARGCSISEFVPYDPTFGGEWLLGLRWTEEFGPVLTVGSGGVGAEFLSSALRPGCDVVNMDPRALTRKDVSERLLSLPITSLATGRVRRQRARVTLEALTDVVLRFALLADACRPDQITELEVNPLVVSADGLVALDVLASIGSREMLPRLSRPIHKLRRLLTPRTIAVMGVSSQMNPGRVILRNILRAGFEPDAVTVIKPGADRIDGCRAVAGIRMLPAPVDLLVLSVSAAQVPEALIEATEARMAESVIVIPGGLEEKAGTAELVGQLNVTLAEARRSTWQGPLVNGGNCLGVQSRPGRYDTMFIPAHKLGAATGPESPLAIISQSGAFAVSRTTRLPGIGPRYTITVGNQMDATIGDYLAYLESDPACEVFAVYVEGFRPLDGQAVADAVRRITSDGRTVIVYRAGRSADGLRATASHTAAIAGDYVVTRDLLRAAGAVVADSLDDFTELVMLFTMLHGRSVPGRRVGALSNAGYECVAIADHVGALELPPFSERTNARLGSLLEARRLSGIVDVHNPFDVTPITDDETFEAAARAVVEDRFVDVVVIGCVPATPALNTLARSVTHTEDLTKPDAIAGRLTRLAAGTCKPVVAIVDAGALYDPLAQRLVQGGIPTFRSADRAMRLLNVYVEDRFANTVRAEAERWVDEFGIQNLEFRI